jgi:Uma2 family endonuclease
MSLMHAPRRRRVRKLHPPVDPGAVDDLLRFRERFGTDSHHRDEILDGELVVSPVPSRWHERVCQRLFLSLNEFCEARGWDAMLRAEVELPPNRDRVQPDLTVFRDADSLPDMDNLMPLDHVLLVAEVVSASSIKRDREIKPRLCGRAGVPLYLLIDRFTEPISLTILSKPGADGYAKTDTVAFGEKLHLPSPFEFTLDTSGIPVPR